MAGAAEAPDLEGAGAGAGLEAAGEPDADGNVDDGLLSAVPVEVFAEGAAALGVGVFGEFGVGEAVEEGFGGMTKTRSATMELWRWDVEV